MTTKNKVYHIRGKEIYSMPKFPYQEGCLLHENMIANQLDVLLEALNEEKEETKPSLCLHCEQPEHKGHCWISKEETKFYSQSPASLVKEETKSECEHRTFNSNQMKCKDCGKDPYDKPKSTLRERATDLIIEGTYIAGGSPEVADKIISLFKDTLLEEVSNNILVFYPKEYIYREDIIKLIKNI